MRFNAEEIIRLTKERYGHKKYGDDVYFKAPELYALSRQVESLAEVIAAAINGTLDEFVP